MKALVKEQLRVFKQAKWIIGLTALVSTSVVTAVELRGPIKQGALIVGKTKPTDKVLLNDQPLKVSATGDFAFWV